MVRHGNWNVLPSGNRWADRLKVGEVEMSAKDWERQQQRVFDTARKVLDVLRESDLVEDERMAVVQIVNVCHQRLGPKK